MPFPTGRFAGALLALGGGIAIGVGTSALGQAGVPPRFDVTAGEGGYLLVRIEAEGPMAAIAHGHVVVAQRFRGEARYDPSAVTRSQVSIEVAPEDLEPDRRDWRARVGLRGRMPSWQRDAVRSDMVGPGQLDAAHYPAIRFFSSAVRPASGGVEIDGTLDLHGRQNQVTVPVELRTLPDGRLAASGSLTVKPSRFDIRPYAAFGGLLRNRDEAEIRFDLQLTPATPSTTPSP